MATVYLHRTDDEFWKMTPRQLTMLIDQWKLIEKNRDYLRAFIQNGGDPDAVTESVEKTNSAAWAMI